jgi:hypothetical protein
MSIDVEIVEQPKVDAPNPVVPSKKITMDAMKVFSMVKTADGFDNFISKLGLNNDNALSAGTYTFNLVTRNRIMLEAAYRGSWIVGKIIRCVPEDMTKKGIALTTTKGEKELPKFKAAVSRLQISQSLCTLESWARLYGGAIAVIQIKGQDLSTPLRLETITKGQFEGLTVYDRWQLNPDLSRLIDSGPEMGLPKYYDIVNSVTSMQPDAKSATGQIRVHHTRCIRQIGILLPYSQAITEMLWGESVLEQLWDRLISFDNATMSCASLIDRANLRTVKIDKLREVIAAGGQAQAGLEAMFELMRRMQVNEGLTLLDKEDEFSATPYTFSGLSDMMLQFAQQLSGAIDTPLIRLFNQSPAGLNATGDGDLQMYADNILAKQESNYRNPWEVLVKIMWRSEFDKDLPDDASFTFVPIKQASETEKTNNAKTTAETIIGAYEAGLINRATGMVELRNSSETTGLFSNIKDEDIAEAEDDEPPSPDAEVNPETSPADDKEKEKKPTGDSAFKKIRKWLSKR